MSIEEGSLTIPARKSESVHLKLDLISPKTATGNDADFYPIDVTLFAHLAAVKDKPEQILQWSVHGRVQTILRFSPPLLDFGTDFAPGGNDSSRTAVAVAEVPIQALEAHFTDNGFHVEVSRNAENGSSFWLEVTPPPNLAPGSFSQTLQVTPILKSGAHGPRSTLPVVGRVSTDVQLLPSSLVFGRSQVGQRLTEIVLIRSKTGKRISVSLTVPQEVDAVPLEGDINNNPRFRFSFTATSLGSQIHDISCRVNYLDEEVSRCVSMRISYFGISHDGKKLEAHKE